MSTKFFDLALWSGRDDGATIMAMSKTVETRFKQRRKLFIREWRKHRGYTQEWLAAMIARAGTAAIGAGYISERWGWCFVVLAIIFASERLMRVLYETRRE